MIINAAIQEILKGKPGDEIIQTTQEDYYNSSNPQYNDVVEVVRENGKLIILTR